MLLFHNPYDRSGMRQINFELLPKSKVHEQKK